MTAEHASGTRTAAHLLVDCLAAEGCEYVFSVPGEETMDVLDALSAHPSVRPFATRAITADPIAPVEVTSP